MNRTVTIVLAALVALLAFGSAAAADVESAAPAAGVAALDTAPRSCEPGPAAGPVTGADGESSISVAACVEAYQNCLAGCAIVCRDAPIPSICYALCSQQCEAGLGACIGVVIVIGVL